MSDSIPARATISFLPELAIVDDGQRERIRGEIPAAIAARLALTPGVTVSTDALIAALWESPPDTAAVSVRVGVSKLRQTLLGSAVSGGRGGYLLDRAPSEIDLVRWERALAEQTGDDRIRVLDELARHADASLLGALADRPFAAEARASFARLRRAAFEELAEVRIDRAQFDDALALVDRLCVEFPLDERPAELRARALAGAGRIADALEALDRLRERMRDELGLEPSSSVTELRASIVRQTPTGVEPAAGSQVERHGIPTPLTQFIGRDAELRSLDEARAESRLITIVGPGGVGKTRLAIESARRATLRTDQEQWMVDLASIAAHDSLVRAIAERLAVPEPTVEAIARRLDGRRVLLILDNAEHLLDALRPVVRDLLHSTRGLRLVVTSREPLKIPGERVVTVAPMLDDRVGEAVRLFRARAREVRPDLDWETQETQLERICTVLDGVPLALELAAAQLDVLDLDEVAHAVVDGAEAPGLPSRHVNLTDTIRASVDLLLPAERSMLAQVARFAGTFRLDDAVGVCQLEAGGEAAVVRRLVQKSLLSPSDHAAAGRRYRVLESVKSYARAHLDAGSTTAWSARHRAWCAELAESLAPALLGHDAPAARATLDLATPDLRLALDSAIEVGDRDGALRIAGSQTHYWMSRGLLREGRAALERARAVPGNASPAAESVAVTGIALLSYQSGDPAAATRYLQEAPSIVERAGDTSRLAILRAYAAYATSLFGNRAETLPLMESALALLPEAEPWAVAEVTLCQGQAVRALGQPALALERLAEARELASKIGYAWIATSARYVAGKVLVDVRRARDAVELLVPGARRALADEDPTSALALMHLVGGASALLDRQRDGAVIFGAVDALGPRFGYHPVRTEGADAQAHRDRVRGALGAAEWRAALAEGARLDFEGLFAVGTGLLATRGRSAA